MGDVVYLLMSDHFVVDVYRDPLLAYTAAEEIMRSAPTSWTQTRPGRWYGPHGRILEVKARTISTSVVRSMPVAS